MTQEFELPGGVHGWNHLDVTWAVDASIMDVPGDFAEQVMHAFAWASQQWQVECLVRFALVEPAKLPNILLCAKPPLPVAAHSEIPCKVTRAVRCFIDAKREWDYTSPASGPISRGSLSLYLVLLHEIGHLIGIPHLDPGNVMAPVYAGIRTLQKGDVEEAVLRYGGRLKLALVEEVPVEPELPQEVEKPDVAVPVMPLAPADVTELTASLFDGEAPEHPGDPFLPPEDAGA